MSSTPQATLDRMYALDNEHPTGAEHHDCLSEMLNPFTMSRVRALGRRHRLVDWRAARVLDIGSGYGSFAREMAELVGPAGSVVALDLKPQPIDHPRVDVVAGDVTIDQPLPGAPYDLIHARLVLNHLPARERILDRMVDALAPGGVVLVEDWAPQHHNVVMRAPSDADADLYAKYALAAGAAFKAAGNDPTWARRVYAAMTDRGLVDADTVIHGDYWHGGQAGLRMVAAVLPQLRPRLLAAGMTEDELARMPALVHNPALVVHSHLLYSTAGWRMPG